MRKSINGVGSDANVELVVRDSEDHIDHMSVMLWTRDAQTESSSGVGIVVDKNELLGMLHEILEEVVEDG